MKNQKYIARTTVNGEQKGQLRMFCTEIALSNYANKMFDKFGDATIVTAYDYETLKLLVTYGA